MAHVLIAEARFYAHLNDMLLAGARAAIEAAMPGSAGRMAYFFHKLPTLRSDQKAAAVHLGLFPDAAQLASAPSYPPPNTASPSAPTGDRLSSIDELLARGAPSATQRPLASNAARVPTARSRVQLSDAREAAPSGQVYSTRRIWLQLASASNPAALPDEYRRITSRDREFFEGISGHVVEEPQRTRLVIGPFRNEREAEIFAEDLATLRVDASRWVNPPGQIIRKLSVE